MNRATAEPQQGVDAHAAAARRLRALYALLTLALFAPLCWAFVNVRNLYPFAASTMMMGGGSLEHGSVYHVLRGETVAGEIIDLRPARLTDALSGRHTSLVNATVHNKSLTYVPAHPANAALLKAVGGADRLPPAVRLPELLRAWGASYNERLPEGSPRRLRAVRLDEYSWGGRVYGDYERFVQTWRTEL